MNLSTMITEIKTWHYPNVTFEVYVPGRLDATLEVPSNRANGGMNRTTAEADISQCRTRHQLRRVGLKACARLMLHEVHEYFATEDGTPIFDPHPSGENYPVVHLLSISDRGRQSL